MEQTLTKEVTKLVTKAETLTVTNADELAEASTRYKLLKDQLKIVENHEAKVIKPLNDALKAARAEWRPLKDSLKAAAERIRHAMSAYQTAEAKRSEEQKKKIAARIGDGKGHLKLETALDKIAEVETPDNKVGEVAFVTDYEIVIDDITKVPFEYLRVELKRTEVKVATKAGKTIPGLTIREVKVPRAV